MVRLLETDHLDDQLAALAWLHAHTYAAKDRIAVAGNSFGGTASRSIRRRGECYTESPTQP